MPIDRRGSYASSDHETIEDVDGVEMDNDVEMDNGIEMDNDGGAYHDEDDGYHEPGEGPDRADGPADRHEHDAENDADGEAEYADEDEYEDGDVTQTSQDHSQAHSQAHSQDRSQYRSHDHSHDPSHDPSQEPPDPRMPSSSPSPHRRGTPTPPPTPPPPPVLQVRPPTPPTAASVPDGPPSSSASTPSSSSSATTASAVSPNRQPQFRPQPEALSAQSYDVVPTMAAPMATSIDALAVTPDLRYWMTGGSDGYIRKYDGPGTVNGKLQLTVAQRHPFVDSVTKAGILMSYWENNEPAGGRGGGGGGSGGIPPQSGRATSVAAASEDHVQSPVYALAVHSRALWLLSGLLSGGINLQTVRHDEGTRIACLQRHTNAVSVLQLAPDEESVLSGSWDKTILSWDLHTGAVARSFEGSGGQISAIELRPTSGMPVPFGADRDLDASFMSDTFYSHDGRRGRAFGGSSRYPGSESRSTPLADAARAAGRGDSAMSPDPNGVDAGADEFVPVPSSPGGNESLFGGSDAGSLFGDMADSGGFGGGGGGDDDDVFNLPEFEDRHSPTHGGGGLDSTMDVPMVGIEEVNQQQQQHGLDQAMHLDGGPVRGPGTALDGDGQEEEYGSANAARLRSGPASPSAALDFEDGTSAAAAAAAAAPAAVAPAAAPAVAAAVVPPDGSSPARTPSSSSAPSAVLVSAPPPAQYDQTQVSHSQFLAASIDGTLRIWDRRSPNPVARIANRTGTPPWCMGACWSPDGNWIYAGRRNGTVEEYSIHRASAGWGPERTLRFPHGSGPVTAVRPMANGRHLVCASHDILRLYDLAYEYGPKASVPFLIIPGPPKPGSISHIYIDPTARFMITTAGSRGWEGSCTEVLLGYEISSV